MPLIMQGAWKPRQIDNPDYKGEWEHPQIDNPEYSPDDKLYFYEDSGYVGLDLWQVNKCFGHLCHVKLILIPGEIWYNL